MVSAPPHLGIQKPIAFILDGVVKIHPFRTKHPFIHRMVRVAFNLNCTVAIFFYQNTTAYTAIGACTLETMFSLFLHSMSVIRWSPAIEFFNEFLVFKEIYEMSSVIIIVGVFNDLLPHAWSVEWN